LAAPLTFGFTTLPGIVLHAGLLHDFHYPSCGCDACDESVADQVELLEEHLFDVVAARYRKSCRRQLGIVRGGVIVGYSLSGGSGHGGPGADHFRPGLLKTAQAKLQELPDGWARWPLRGLTYRQHGCSTVETPAS